MRLSVSPHDYAAVLVARGFPVFQLSDSRRPIEKGFSEKATTKLNGEWRGNIGVATGGDLLVIDVDVKNGAQGRESLDLLGLPRHTFTVSTPSGGLHLYYRIPAGIWRNRVNWFPGIDVRGYHGYVIGPGSEKDGKFYEIELDAPAADLPAMFWGSLAGRPSARKATILPEWVDNEPATAAATAYLVDEAPVLTVGERDDGLIKIANRIMDFGVSPNMAAELIAEHWLESKCDPTVPFKDVLKKCLNAAKSRRDPIGIFPPRPSAVDCFEVEKISPEKQPYSRFVWGERLVAEALAADKPLVQGFVERGAVSLWFGDSNAGKSFVLLAMADAIAAGEPFAGRPTAKGAVCYFAGEGGRGIKQRALALRIARGRGLAHPLFLFPVPGELLGRAVDAERMIADIGAAESACGLQCNLIVIDTLARTFDGDENAAADMGRFIRCIDLIRRDTPAHVAIVHHSGKDAARGARGSSALRAAIDSEFQVIAGRSVTCTKQRDMEQSPPLRFALVRVPIGSVDGTPIISAVAEVEIGAAPPESEAAKPLSDSVDGYLDMLEPGDEWTSSADWAAAVDAVEDAPLTANQHRSRRAKLLAADYVEMRGPKNGLEYRRVKC
jgi:hypothetical protein